MTPAFSLLDAPIAAAVEFSRRERGRVLSLAACYLCDISRSLDAIARKWRNTMKPQNESLPTP